jgi:archaellum component FlaC
MTTDERLDRLAERHEALAQTVEILTRDIQDLKSIAQQDGEHIRLLTANVDHLTGTVNTMVWAVQAHELRLKSLEGPETA